MKLSIFTTATDPYKRGDNYRDSMACFKQLADEIVLVDGHCTSEADTPAYKQIDLYWPKEFDWLQISRSYQKGYDACTGDWVLFADLDFLFHEKDFENIRQVLSSHPSAPALSFYKYQFILPDRYNIKSRRVIAINKAKFGDRIKMNGGGDLCQTTLDGKHLTPDDVPESGIAFYNYEKILKTKEQIMDDVGRMERAYQRHFGRTQYGSDGTSKDAFNKWIEAQKGKFAKPQKHIRLDEHPKFIQDTIIGLKPENWGYSGFGHLEVNDYVKEFAYA